MVANCANPGCTTRFKYWSQGKIFRFGPSPTDQAVLNQEEWFWLCATCSTNFTLQCSPERGVLPVPLPRKQHAQCA
jgi:hypothetical protein